MDLTDAEKAVLRDHLKEHIEYAIGMDGYTEEQDEARTNLATKLRGLLGEGLWGKPL